jgi:D-alanine-D-alanine ligase
LKKKFGFPMFIKPANLGSSVGVSKVTNENEFKNAVKLAFKYDVKILVEQAVLGREIEVSVLGNENPIASVPGEVITQNGFYSYEAKYIDENGALLEVPAKLSLGVVKKIQNTALKTYKTLCLEGMARVDMFLTKSGRVVINEVNTIPGFTNISMYPKLWEVSGISYTKLLSTLIQLALQRHNRQQQLKTSL